MKITSRMIAILVVMALIPIISLGMLSYFGASDLLVHPSKDMVKGIAGLEAVSELKVKIIEDFFRERKADIRVAQDFYNIKTNLPIVTKYASDRSNPEYLGAKKMLDGQLRTFQKVYGYLDIMLVSPDGRIVYSSDEVDEQADLGEPLDNISFSQGRRGVYLSDVFVHAIGGRERVQMLMTAPVYSLSNQFIGEIAFEIGMNGIYGIANITTGLGDTGETVIAARMKNHEGKFIMGHETFRKGEHALVLNELRNRPNSAMRTEIFFGDEFGFPLQEAVRGVEGSGISVDYNGVKVLAVWKHITEPDWGIVTKISMEEVTEDLYVHRDKILLVAVISIIISVFIALLLSRSLTKPILDLKETLEAISHGKLEAETGELKERPDEIGDLARSFERISKTMKVAVMEKKIAPFGEEKARPEKEFEKAFRLKRGKHGR